ncbi:RloB domain-containing protein, partial [Nonomuraea sp. RK-328]|nr:RloB domain-containing protein [Nonomuraea sp. RK-328]
VSGRPRGGSDLRRRRNTRREKPRILIVTEGENTEPQYFNGLARELRASGVEVFRLQVEGIGRDPARVVRKAAAASADAPHNDGFDHVWCVVDVDEHETLAAALRTAERLGIHVAVSNPCFEIWILWHFMEHRAHIDKKTLGEKLKRLGMTGKNLPSHFPFIEYSAAVTRAESRGETGEYQVAGNPSSSVCRLVRVLTRRSQ